MAHRLPRGKDGLSSNLSAMYLRGIGIEELYNLLQTRWKKYGKRKPATSAKKQGRATRKSRAKQGRN
ncbi:hypothetical protein QUF64_09730 [Anaerolineales bacterium HSG6]|nr:hypothetical protein [Anaerolineales bacterium HSG6]